MSLPGRAYCYACLKPRVTCVCARVPRIDNQTAIWLLQHPRERRHAIGTARLLALGLAKLRLDVIFLRGPRAALPRPSPRAALLYPSPDARALEELGPDERPDQLIVLDGTWHHAHALARELGWLEDLPRVTLRDTTPSRYRIRREPRAECLSTVEAVVAALAVLEPETAGLDRLLGAFDSMIDDQVEYVLRRAGPRRAKVRRASGARGVARAVTERWEDLTLVYAETAPGPPGARALVQLAALRPQSGERFDRIVRGPTPAGLFHMKLDEADLAGGDDLADVRAAWEDFRHPRALLLAWNQSTLDALGAAGLEGRGLSLKALWANAVERAPGALESVLARAGLRPVPVPVRGRAAERLGNALAVALALRERAGLAP